MLVALVLVAPTVLLAQQLAGQAKEGVRFVNDNPPEIPWQQYLDHYPQLAPLIRWSQQSLDPGSELSKFATWLTGQLSWLLTGSFGFATQLLMMLYIMFYFIRDHRQGISRLRSLVPLSDQETDEVFARVEDTINATIYGTVIVGLVQGLVGWCLYMAVGLPAPLLWGTLTAVLAIVPVLGPSIVWIPAASILAVKGLYFKAAVITIGGIGIGLVGHFLYPILVGHKLRLHPVMVFFAFLGGLTVFGFAGLILGPAVLALTEALVNVWQRRSANGPPGDAPPNPRPGWPARSDLVERFNRLRRRTARPHAPAGSALAPAETSGYLFAPAAPASWGGGAAAAAAPFLGAAQEAPFSNARRRWAYM